MKSSQIRQGSEHDTEFSANPVMGSKTLLTSIKVNAAYRRPCVIVEVDRYRLHPRVVGVPGVVNVPSVYLSEGEQGNRRLAKE